MIWQFYANEHTLLETLEGKLGKTWSVTVEMLQVTRDGHIESVVVSSDLYKTDDTF